MVQHPACIGMVVAFAGGELLYIVGVASDRIKVELIELRLGERCVLPDALQQLFPVVGTEQGFRGLREQEALGRWSERGRRSIAFLMFEPPALHRVARRVLCWQQREAGAGSRADAVDGAMPNHTGVSVHLDGDTLANLDVGQFSLLG